MTKKEYYALATKEAHEYEQGIGVYYGRPTETAVVLLKARMDVLKTCVESERMKDDTKAYIKRKIDETTGAAVMK